MIHLLALASLFALSFRAPMQAPHSSGRQVAQWRLNTLPRPPQVAATARLSEAEALAALREEIERAVADDRFAGAVLVAKNGQTLFSGSWGLADRDRKIPNRLDTRPSIRTRSSPG